MAMKYNDSSRFISEHTHQLRASLLDSPMLLAAFGTFTIAGAAVSGINALILSILVLILLLVVACTTLIDSDRLTYPLKPLVYTGVTTVTLFLIVLLLELFMPVQLERIGVYLPLLAFNSLVLCRSADDAPMLIGSEAVTDSLALAAVFTAVALPVSLIREVLGSGTIFGIELGISSNMVFKFPFMGFILTGFALAAVRAVIAKAEKAGDEQ